MVRVGGPSKGTRLHAISGPPTSVLQGTHQAWIGERPINAIPAATWRSNSAGTGTTITKGGALNTPLGLIIAPNGDVLTVNGGNGLIVETAPPGNQAATKVLDSSGSPPGAGALFGLAVAPANAGVYYVDDAVNTLRLLH